jgi:hypothetical protein
MLKSRITFSFILITVLLFSSKVSYGQLWQWSIPVKGGINKFGPSTAFLWVPPNCAKLRAVVLAQNNMEELSVIENKAFRDSMTAVNIGIIWVSPAFDGLFNVPTGAGKTFTQMMIDLAGESGYKELQYVPVVPMGHSATANFPNSFAAWFPERTLCGVSISAIFPYDFTNIFAPDTWQGRTVDYVPLLTTMGEYEGAGDSSANFDRVFSRREAHPLTPMSLLPCAGEYHFATSQKKINFIAYYIKKAVYYRLIKDATTTSLATLKPIDPTTTGWLVDRWRKNIKPRFGRAKVAAYAGIKNQSFWCFDEDMARRIEDYENAYYGKIPCLLAYNQNGKQVLQTNNHVQVTLKFLPLNDSLDFQLSSSFLDTIPAVSGRLRGWAQAPVGSKIGHPSNPQLSVIDRTIGPFIKLSENKATGVTTFRMQLEPGLASVPTNYRATTIFSLAHPGDGQYKPSVLQADMSIAVSNKKGLTQVIDFPQPANVKVGAGKVILNATSDKNLPVRYLIQQGPVELKGNQLVLTKIPPKSRYPVKVTIIAWQWGRNDDLAAATAVTNAPYAGQLIQTATPVERTFYINK